MMRSRAVITVSSVPAGEVQLVVSGVVDLPAVGELARQLRGVLDVPDVVLVVVDLAAVAHCDCHLLEVLDRAGREVAARDGVLHIRGLDPQALTGFDTATLPAVLGAYRASLGASGRSAAWEPGGTAVSGACSSAEHALARACLELAGGVRVGEVAQRLTEHSARYLSSGSPTAVAAVVVSPGSSGRPVVVASSTERARLVELSGAAAGQGPGMECLRRGELISAPDLTQLGGRWAGYTRAAGLHGYAAARALPIRRPPAGNWPGRATPMIGALVLLAETPGPMTPADLGMAQGFADLAAIGMTGRVQQPGGRTGPAAGLAEATLSSEAALSGATLSRATLSSAALADRVVIEQATGILAERHALSIDQAQQRLHRHAHTHDLSLTEVAREVLAGQLDAPGTPPARRDEQPARPARFAIWWPQSPDSR